MGAERVMKKIADVANMDAKTVIALLIGAVRAERFCDGALLSFLKDGSITR
jgi:3-oxoacyl-[acyl-carrier-protein] synthase III